MIAVALDWNTEIDALAERFRARSRQADRTDAYVWESFAELRALGLPAAMIPEELGGSGMTHAGMCDLLRRIAHACPSTALTTSMHQHLVAVEVWKYRHGKSDGALLRKVAAQGLQLISTGAKDWLGSTGELRPVEGGFRLDGKKSFASGSAGGDRVVTSAVLGDEVLHFSLPLDAPGVRVSTEWEAMGMRGTGSDTIVFEGAFVPEAAITLRRPRGRWHPVWNLVATQAMPLIVSVYIGIAERAAELVTSRSPRDGGDAAHHQQVGEMLRELTAARLAWESMVAIAARDAVPDELTAGDVLARKTLAVEAAIRTVECALELAGGPGYLRASGLEQLYRDALAGRHHPLPARRQAELSGRLALGLGPVGEG